MMNKQNHMSSSQSREGFIGIKSFAILDSLDALTPRPSPSVSGSCRRRNGDAAFPKTPSPRERIVTVISLSLFDVTMSRSDLRETESVSLVGPLHNSDYTRYSGKFNYFVRKSLNDGVDIWPSQVDLYRLEFYT